MVIDDVEHMRKLVLIELKPLHSRESKMGVSVNQKRGNEESDEVGI
jgi:hypothetical protein